MPLTNLESYEKQLKDFDWGYEGSDDHLVWKRGKQELHRLRLIQKELDKDEAIWNKYYRIFNQ